MGPALLVVGTASAGACIGYFIGRLRRPRVSRTVERVLR